VTRGHRHKTANFLKHADHDPDGSLAAENLTESGSFYRATDSDADQTSPGVGQVIAQAINFSLNLGLPITVEMSAYMHWWLGVTAQKPEDFIHTREGPIHLSTLEEQLDFGAGLLEFAYSIVRQQNQEVDPD
jgi:hypothetical protein